MVRYGQTKNAQLNQHIGHWTMKAAPALLHPATSGTPMHSQQFLPLAASYNQYPYKVPSTEMINRQTRGTR